MTEFLEFQSIINYRIPLNSDGTLGQPQVTSKFTRAIKAAREMKPKKENKEITVSAVEEIYL